MRAAVLGPASAYFGLVFGAGFVLGAIRVPLVVPLVGTRAAELCEMPFLLLAIVLAARLVTRRFERGPSPRAWLPVGFLAMGGVLGADLGVGVLLRGLSLSETLLDRDPVSGAAYGLMLLAFALMPFLLARRADRGGGKET